MIQRLPLAPSQIAGPLLVLIISAACFLFEPLSGEWLAYDRYAIQGFETWRLLTGNLVHTNGYHLLLNAAGLALLWALHGDYYRFISFIKLFLWCSLGTSALLYWFSPELIWYAGLSGALHGVFVWGACCDIRQRMQSGWLLLLGVVIKIGYEQTGGDNTQVAELIDASVAIDAHLYGAISGLMLFALVWLTKKR